jgi:6-pyruvoyltetrahydropterin/6-carboxytetrahydropterin synthase
MVMDFREAKRIIGEIINRFDHTYLNELTDFQALNPTTENLSKILFEYLKNALPAGVIVAKVTTWESDRCGAAYFE